MRKILSIKEKMKIILDFQNESFKEYEEKIEFNDIIHIEKIKNKLLDFLGRKSLLKLRIVSRIFKEIIENHLDLRLIEDLTKFRREKVNFPILLHLWMKKSIFIFAF